MRFFYSFNNFLSSSLNRIKILISINKQQSLSFLLPFKMQSLPVHIFSNYFQSISILLTLLTYYLLQITLMKQILSLHIGQCGVQVAQSSWQLFCLQHGITPQGLPNNKNFHQEIQSSDTFSGDINTLFYESSSGKLTPRAIIADLQPTVIDELKVGKQKKLFSKQLMISGKQDTANNFIRGQYTIGKQIIDILEDKVRREIEKTDYFQASIFTHSINGGTGSGFCALVMERFSVNYPKKFKLNLLVYPSQRFSSSVVQTYNAVLSGHSLLEHSDLSIPVTNQRMYTIMQEQLDVQKPTFSNINHLMSQLTSNITAGGRFHGENNGSIRDLVFNLVPYPRIHFVIPSFNKFNPSASYGLLRGRQQLNEITKEAFSMNNYLVDIKRQNSKLISAFLMYRSENKIFNEAVACAKQIKNNETVKFVDWSPTGIKICVNNKNAFTQKSFGYDQTPLSLNILQVNMRIDSIFGRVNHKFDLMYARRAFVHWYVGEGLDQGFFSEARQDLAALEKDYEDGSDFFQEFQDEEQVQ